MSPVCDSYDAHFHPFTSPNECRCESPGQARPESFPGQELDSCKVIMGFDFTASNRTSGMQSFKGKCLHDISCETNPYTDAIVAIDSILSVYGYKQAVHCYGFGNSVTGTERVFSIFSKNKPAPDFDHLVTRYEQIAPLVELSVQTSFAPLIKQAILEVYRSGMVFHVLFILSDGQLSEECLEESKEAMAVASDFPLCIVMIGVGDGPWAKMESLTEFEAQRPHHNCLFVDSTVLFTGSEPGFQCQSPKRPVSTILSSVEAQFTYWQDSFWDTDKEKRIAEVVDSISPDLVTNPFQFD